MADDVTVAEIDWLTSASRMPWPVVTPVRMRPNLQKLGPVAPALLLRDDLSGVYRRERELVIAAHPKRALVGSADNETLATILGLVSTPLASTPQGQRGRETALSLQEDFVILKQDGDTLRTEYLSVCFPSRWDPREKLGLDFAAIHAPVADNSTLLAAGPNLMTMAFITQPMLRHVWLIVPAANLDQHPEKNQVWWREALLDPSPLLPRLYFRIERQTTWPLPHLQRAVFFIRLMMSPLTEVLRISAPVRPERSEGSDGLVTRAAELAAALRSMTPAIVAYRGMTHALPRLLTELDTFE